MRALIASRIMTRTTIDLDPSVLRQLKARQRREGKSVETELELATLRALGVPLAQGYLMGRPAPVDTWAEPTGTRPPDGPGLPDHVALSPPAAGPAGHAPAAISSGSQNQRRCSKSAPTASGPSTPAAAGGGSARIRRACAR